MKNLQITCQNTFTKSQINLPTIQKEAFAIFYALHTLDQYLHDSEFVIRTDHKPFRNLVESVICINGCNDDEAVLLWSSLFIGALALFTM